MKIKLSKSQWQFIGKKAGWIKSAGGWGRFNEDLSDIIEGKVTTNKDKTIQEIAAEIKADNLLKQMMQEEEMSDSELIKCIEEHRKYSYL